MKTIYYKDGYKHVLHRSYSVQTPIKPEKVIMTDTIQLDTNGLLTIFRGFAWDGASGPTLDGWGVGNVKRASLVHDAFYALMRQGYIPDARPQADELLRDIMIEDGCWKWRAKIWCAAVKKFAKKSSTPAGERKIKRAP